MANVYRQGTKSVHRSIRTDGHRFDVQACALDPGGTWLPAIPPGPRCEACFGSPHPGGDRKHPKRSSVVAATTAGLLAAAVVVGSSMDEPVNYFPVDSSLASASAYASEVPASFTPSVTPGPLSTPSEAPVLTPRPTTLEPAPTLGPDPTKAPVIPQPTYPPFTFPPLPTLPPIVLPTLPPLPVDCRHPGEHFGNDGCRWPHQ